MDYIIYGIIHLICGILTIIIIIKTEGKDGAKISYLIALGIILLGTPLFILALIGFLHHKKIN